MKKRHMTTYMTSFGDTRQQITPQNRHSLAYYIDLQAWSGDMKSMLISVFLTENSSHSCFTSARDTQAQGFHKGKKV